MANSSCCDELVSEAMAYVKAGSAELNTILGCFKHEDLQNLKSCAESGGCSICCVLWAAIERQCPPNLLQQYLDKWEVADGLIPGSLVIMPKHGLASFAICVSRPFQGKVEIGNVNFSSEYGSFFVNGHCRARYAGESQYPQDRRRTISITNEWLQYCKGNHERCGDSQQKNMPTRVVYIGKGSCIRLLETQPGQDDTYVALSYMWGDGGPPSLRLLNQTVGRSLTDLQRKINWSELTSTHQHAIQVARELGYNYIWIDALCVIQNDDNDWAIEAPRLPKIYGNADLTIVAGRSNDYKKGFLYPTLIPIVQPAQIPVPSLDNQATDKCWFSFPRTRTIGITDTRGWCFQEALFSRRMIIYGEEQLSFRCHENHYFEDGHVLPIQKDFWYDLAIRYRGGYRGGYRFSLPMHYARTKLQAGNNTAGTTPIRNVTMQQNNEILDRWYLLAQEFSARSFYDPTDNHAALSGAAIIFQEALSVSYNSPRYMAGLWDVDMVRGLMWEIDPDSPSALPVRKDNNGTQTVVSRAPSWSWMSLVGRISYRGADSGQGRYSQASPDLKTWGPNPDGWGPSMIIYKDFPPIFRLEVKAYIRKVRISQARLPILDDTSRYIDWFLSDEGSLPPVDRLGANWHFPESEPPIKFGKKTANAFKRFLEAEEEAPNSITGDEEFAAEGFFDMKSTIDNPPATGIHAMRLTSKRGLLLEQIPDPDYKLVAYKRLGTFSILNKKSFYPPEAFDREWAAHYRDLFGHDLSEDKLPNSIVVLV